MEQNDDTKNKSRLEDLGKFQKVPEKVPQAQKLKGNGNLVTQNQKRKFQGSSRKFQESSITTF